MASASFTVSVGVHGVFIRLLQKEERGRERGNSEDWELTFGWVGHPEISPEFLNRRHPGRDGHFFCDCGEGIVQTPSIPGAKFVHKWLEVEVRCLWQQADRQNTFYEDVVQDRLRIGVRHCSIFQVRYFASKPPEMILESEHRMVDLGSEVQPRRVFAIEGNEVPAEDHVVAD